MHTGLNAQDVQERRRRFGSNTRPARPFHRLWEVVREIITEPLFLLLVAAAALYFLLGEMQEALIMLLALGFVAGISLFQETRSRQAVAALQLLTQPRAMVIREGCRQAIDPGELVVDDLLLLEDGDIIPADARLLETHDLTVDESILTGESLPVAKTCGPEGQVFQGTSITGGSALAVVTAVGPATTIGGIDAAMHEVRVDRTPLQQQIRSFIRRMVAAGALAFLLVWGLHYLQTGDILHSLLQGLTLAMSILPEEIPVAFSTFMALGAYHLYKRHVIARSPHTVETLGAATVICTDKTGTLTENRMSLAALYDRETDQLYEAGKEPFPCLPVLEFAMWASETEPFDPMEKALHEAYAAVARPDLRPGYRMVREYPLGGQPPLMTHVFDDGSAPYPLIAAKGSVEALLEQSALSASERALVLDRATALAEQGYRVLGVGRAQMALDALPQSQQAIPLDFLGLVAFADPPKANIEAVLQSFYSAGIQVKMITGDYAHTARAIAGRIGMDTGSGVLTGAEVMQMTPDELERAAGETHLFARMFPEAKLRIIESLKRKGEVVAMTGDGVNDGPALKAAHIGIAMGKRGSETARNASALILTDDDLGRMVEAIALGRRIYENLKKAIRYIISIHIPIILIITIPLLLAWTYTDIFSPIHVIFLELIMGPTCSIVFEKEPIERGSMQRPPRPWSASFFSWSELHLSIIQGLVLTAGCLGLGYAVMQQGASAAQTRTVIYATLIFGNIFLTLVNRSFYHSLLHTLRYSNPLIPVAIGAALLVLGASIYYPPVRAIFGFEALAPLLLLSSLTVAVLSVCWIELWKYRQRRLNPEA